MARDDNISFADWIATVKEYAAAEGFDYEELAEHYSFRQAYDDEMGMLEAFLDCVRNQTKLAHR